MMLEEVTDGRYCSDYCTCVHNLLLTASFSWVELQPRRYKKFEFPLARLVWGVFETARQRVVCGRVFPT